MNDEYFTKDKAEWQWDSAAGEYLQMNGIATQDLNSKQQEIVWQWAANHIAMFLTWLIDRDLLSEEHQEWSAQQQAVRQRRMTGYDYLRDNCDLTLVRDDLSEAAAIFADAFYDSHYLREYSICLIEQCHQSILATPFRWEDYEIIKAQVLETAYTRFLADTASNQ